MPDRLYQAIEGAIGLELDGRVFERCAVDLLRKGYYADLRGTLHERDAGMDGISGPDSDPEFILIATTSNDFARNLRSSVKRYVGAGGRGRTVVFATTRKVTGERRLRLRRELLDRWHVQLREVHDQGDFIHLLYHDPQWRRGLLNVAGIAKTLSRFPANARPTPLTHPAGQAQCDFGQARAVIGGVEQAIHYFALELAHSDGCFVKAYPAETTEAFCDGHVAAFRSWAECRGASCTTTPGWQWPRSWETGGGGGRGCSRSLCRTTCSRIGSGVDLWGSPRTWCSMSERGCSQTPWRPRQR